MGGGSYSFSSRSERSESLGFTTKSIRENFKERRMNDAMSPYGVKIRESRDSAEHPNSVAIIFALDVTGSMLTIPQQLIQTGLPTMMQGIIDAGILDPQVMFCAIGDHECDRSPLQVSQFESSDELLDTWLLKTFLEAGGGANAGESYHLAHEFAAFHTEIDCFEKRGQKGFLFTVGDEPTLKNYPADMFKHFLGEEQSSTYTAEQLLEEARKKYNVYHFHVKEGSNGRSQRTIDGWKQLMGQNLIIVEDIHQIPHLVAKIVSENVQITNSLNTNPTSYPMPTPSDGPAGMML